MPKVTTTSIQTAIFPIDHMHITQGEYGEYSHQDRLAIDFVGPHDEYPYNAPYDMELIGRHDSWAGMIWKTQTPVLCADGNTRNIVLRAIHECNPAYVVGDKINQGAPMGKTGVCGNVTGDHVHFEAWEGTTDTTDPNKALHLYDVFVLPPSITIIDDYGYEWRYETDPPQPEPPEQPHFITNRHNTNMRRMGVRGRR